VQLLSHSIKPIVRQGLVLLLCDEVQSFPWESIPLFQTLQLQSQSTLLTSGGKSTQIGISRAPWIGAVSIASVSLELNDIDSLSILKTCKTDKVTDKVTDNVNNLTTSLIEMNLCQGLKRLKKLISMTDTPPTTTTTTTTEGNLFYIVNPTGDLPRTEETILKVIQDANKSLVSTSHGLSYKDCIKEGAKYQAIEMIKSSDLFLFSGHGAGETLLPRETIPTSLLGSFPHGLAPPTMLMGCSSGKFCAQKFITSSSSSSSYSSSSTLSTHIHSFSSVSECGALSYLYAGSPSVLACLWDVTDKDIDRLTGALVLSAVSHTSSSILSSSMSNIIGQGLSAHLKLLRSSCKLPYLTGAAVVTYGMPL